LEIGFADGFLKEIEDILKLLKSQGTIVDYEFKVHKQSEILANAKIQSEKVAKVSKKFFGEENTGKGILPVLASEDFCFYSL